MEINLINLIQRYGDDKKCRKYRGSPEVAGRDDLSTL